LAVSFFVEERALVPHDAAIVAFAFPLIITPRGDVREGGRGKGKEGRGKGKEGRGKGKEGRGKREEGKCFESEKGLAHGRAASAS